MIYIPGQESPDVMRQPDCNDHLIGGGDIQSTGCKAMVKRGIFLAYFVHRGSIHSENGEASCHVPDLLSGLIPLLGRKKVCAGQKLPDIKKGRMELDLAGQ